MSRPSRFMTCRQRVLNALAGTKLTMREVAAVTEILPKSVSSAIVSLQRSGKVQDDGGPKGKRKYSVIDAMQPRATRPRSAPIAANIAAPCISRSYKWG